MGFSDIERGKNLQVEPYLWARNLRQLNTINPDDPYFQDKHLQGYGGVDAKFILHNSLVLDTTINPDFSQVGIDNPAIPNQRFPPYFAEVRPFFIETAATSKRRSAFTTPTISLSRSSAPALQGNLGHGRWASWAWMMKPGRGGSAGRS